MIPDTQKDTLLLTIKQRLVSLVYTATIFHLIYTLTNVYSAKLNQLSTLPTIANFFLPLDSHIPFIAFMILPYACSLGLFIASFFVVRTQRQLQQLTHQLLLTTTLAGLCFYYVPLQFSFDVTHVLNTEHKVWQLAYQFLHTVDKPHNQLPSLHVAYAIVISQNLWKILINKYAKMGLLLLATLISISTLFTWQHHLLDVFAGGLLAMLVLGIDKHLCAKKPSTTKNSIIKYMVVAVSSFIILEVCGFLLFSNFSKSSELSGILTNEWLLNMLYFINVLFHISAYYLLFSFMLLAIAYYYPSLNWFSKKIINTHGQSSGKHTYKEYFLFTPIIIIYRLLWWGASQLNLVQIPTVNSIITITVSNTISNNKTANNKTANQTANNQLLEKQVFTNQPINPCPIDILAMGKLTITNIKKLQFGFNQFEKYTDIIWLDVGCEINSSFDTFQHMIMNDSTCHYLHTPMLDMMSWSESQHPQINSYCQTVDNLLHYLNHKNSKNNQEIQVLILANCVMGWSRSVALLACILAYYQQGSVNSINKRIQQAYPKSHVDKILHNQLLEMLILRDHVFDINKENNR